MLAAGRSYLVNRSSLASLDLAEVSSVDRLEVTAEEMVAKRAREVISLATQSPLGIARLLLINDADKLSEIVQNSLLKLIEEPPERLIIVLVTDHDEKLLPTIKSRLEKVTKKADAAYEVEKLTEHEALANIKERPKLIEELEKWRRHLKNQLLSDGQKLTAKKLGLIDRSLTRLEANCSQKLVLDSLLLQWKRLLDTQISDGN